MGRRAKAWNGVSGEELTKRWGRDVHLFGTVESTNDTARALADEGSSAGVVLARAQSSGRGREGRVWASPAGAGVYLSMIFRSAMEEISPLVTIVAGLDIAGELNRAFPGLDAKIKWPNDLMARDKKLGGILVEASKAEDGQVLIVGVGINVVAKDLPSEFEGAIALDACVDASAPLDVADAIVSGLGRRVAAVPQALGEEDFDDLDRLDWLRNRRVRHRLGDAEPTIGTAAGIAPDGAFLLRPDRGALRRVVAGSVEVIDPNE